MNAAPPSYWPCLRVSDRSCGEGVGGGGVGGGGVGGGGGGSSDEEDFPEAFDEGWCGVGAA